MHIVKGTNWLFVTIVLGLLILILGVNGALTPPSLRRRWVVNHIRIGTVEGLRRRLEAYYQDNQAFPESLADLPGGPPLDPVTGMSYSYAYWPSKKPVRVHFGIVLEANSGTETETALARDADFDSRAAGYMGGFDGADPVYDLRLTP